MRVVSVADSSHIARDAYRVYMLRLATLTARGPQQYSLGWKQTGRGAADGKRPEEGTPAFAEMAVPGTTFEGSMARECIPEIARKCASHCAGTRGNARTPVRSRESVCGEAA